MSKIVKCHLYKLMAVNKVNIKDVHEKTGISRNALSALYHEKVDGIKFDTLIKLGDYFNCEISDLLEFVDE